MTYSGFTYGPLNKNRATYLLDSICRNLLSPNYENYFDLQNNSLLLTQHDKDSNCTIVHDISILLKSADLSHIAIFDEQSSHFYIQKMQEIYSGDNQLDEHFKKANENNNLSIIQKARNLAITLYTGTFDINSILRNNLEILHNDFDRNFDEFQERCFSALTTGIFTQNYLQNQASQLKPDQDHSNNVICQITTTKAKRIEFYNKRPKIFNYLSELKQPQSENISFQANGFTSYSISNKLELQQPGNALKHPGHHNTNLPLINNEENNITIVIHEAEIPKITIGNNSLFPDEKECIAPPSAKKLQLIDKIGNIVFLKTHHVSSPDLAAPDDLRQIALSHLYYNILNRPYPKPYSHDPDCLTNLIINPQGDKVTIYRNNHGLAHAARKMCMASNILQLYMTDAKNKRLRSRAKIIYKNSIHAELVSIAAAFSTVGRINELTKKDNPNDYKKSRQNSGHEFDKFISIHYPHELRTQRDQQLIDLCSWSIQYAGKETKNKSDNIVSQIIFTAHILDLPRVPDVNIQIAKRILLSKLINKTKSVLLNKPSTIEKLDQLWELSLERLRATGDRITDERDSYISSEFALCSQNPRHLAKILGIKKSRHLIIDESKLDHDPKIYLDALSYVLKNSSNADEQLKIFLTQPQYFDLIQHAKNYILKHPDENFDIDSRHITQIKRFYNLNVFNKTSNELRTSSLSRAISDFLPLKNLMIWLQTKKLDNSKNRSFLKKIRKTNPELTRCLLEIFNRYQDTYNAEQYNFFKLMSEVDRSILIDIVMKINSVNHYNQTSSIYIQLYYLYISNPNMKIAIELILIFLSDNLDRSYKYNAITEMHKQNNSSNYVSGINYLLPIIFASYAPLAFFKLIEPYPNIMNEITSSPDFAVFFACTKYYDFIENDHYGYLFNHLCSHIPNTLAKKMLESVLLGKINPDIIHDGIETLIDDNKIDLNEICANAHNGNDLTQYYINIIFYMIDKDEYLEQINQLMQINSVMEKIRKYVNLPDDSSSVYCDHVNQLREHSLIQLMIAEPEQNSPKQSPLVINHMHAKKRSRSPSPSDDTQYWYSYSSHPNKK